VATNYKYKLIPSGYDKFKVFLGGDGLVGEIRHVGIHVSVPKPHLKLGWVVKGGGGMVFANPDDAAEEAIRSYLAKEELADDIERIRRASSKKDGVSS